MTPAESKAKAKADARRRSQLAARRTSGASTDNTQSETTEKPPALYQPAQFNVPEDLHEAAALIQQELQKIAQSQSVLLSLWQKLQGQINGQDYIEFTKPVQFDQTIYVKGNATIDGVTPIGGTLAVDGDVQVNRTLYADTVAAHGGGINIIPKADTIGARIEIGSDTTLTYMDYHVASEQGGIDYSHRYYVQNASGNGNATVTMYQDKIQWQASAGAYAYSQNGELVSFANSGDTFRHVDPSGMRSTFWRNDHSTSYLMITNDGDPFGNWNDLRPFMVDLATGKCTIQGIVGAWEQLTVNESDVITERRADMREALLKEEIFAELVTRGIIAPVVVNPDSQNE